MFAQPPTIPQMLLASTSGIAINSGRFDPTVDRLPLAPLAVSKPQIK